MRRLIGTALCHQITARVHGVDELRPMRIHFDLAPQPCNRLVPIFAVLKDVTDGATVGAAQGLTAAGSSGALVDVGTALNIALSSGDRFANVVVNNGELLKPAENTSWVSDLWALVCETATHLQAAGEL